MKRTSKLLILLAAIGMLVGCSGKKNSGGGDSKPSGDDKTPAADVLLNVIYFNSYVSENRANEIKTGLVSALTAAGESVTANQFNFFQSKNSKVAGLGEEILDYNEENPSHTIDVILGANNFSAWDDTELKPVFEAKYENDGEDYTYGTHATLSNNTNRKFFYDKAKVNDKYVKALQNYLKANWQSGSEPPAPETSQLTVYVYGNFVSQERTDELFEGFKSYLAANSITINDLGFVRDFESTTLVDFADALVKYNTDNPTEKADVLLGLKVDTSEGKKVEAAGYAMSDKTDYNYGTTEGKENDRRFWLDPNSANIANIRHLEAYLKANWVPGAEPVNHYYLTGSFNEWATTGLTQELAKVEDNHYRISNVDFAANTKFKVYSPEEQKYYSNDSTWADCGFTLDGDKNIVLESEGTYTIDLHLDGQNNNFVTLEKQAAAKTIFTIGIYDKFVDSTRAAALKAGVEAHFAANDINADVISTNLGTGNISACATAITTYNTAHADAKIDVVLGLKQDKDSAIATAGYEIGDVNYTYGNAGGAADDRKITVLPASKARAEYLAFLDYMNANWLYVVEPDYYLIGSITDWNVETLSYKLTKVEAGTYKYENLQLSAGATIKVFIPGETPTYFTNASTWTDCGFTLGENNNIVVTNGGIYTINFFVEGQNDNHITIEKTAELPASQYYLIGSFNSWSQEDTTYPLTLVEGNVFKYANFVVESEIQFKVLKVTGNAKELITNASTWADCGFTLGENNNIVVSEAGKYNIVLNLDGLNSNFITLEKVVPPTFTIAYYAKFISEANITALTSGIEKYFEDNNVEATLVFTTLGTSGTNVSAFAGLVVDYNTAHADAHISIFLGANGDSTDKELAAAGYAKESDTNYSYGTDAKRKLWCQTGHAEDAMVLAVKAYLGANWAVA